MYKQPVVFFPLPDTFTPFTLFCCLLQCQQKWLAKVAWRVVCEARGISSEWTSMDDIALLEHVDAVAPGTPTPASILSD